MRNIHGDGILCDYCNDEYVSDFTYYSYDFIEMNVREHSHRAKPDPVLSADICEKCMEAYRKRVKTVYKPSIRGRFVCDVSGEVITTSDFKYYKCIISEVNVLMSGKQYECSKCGNILKDENDGCPRCVEGVGVRHADVDIDGDYLVIDISEGVFIKFVEHITNIKNVEKNNG